MAEQNQSGAMVAPVSPALKLPTSTALPSRLATPKALATHTTTKNQDVKHLSISPFIEQNQGLVSVVALVVALIFALFEQWRANNAGRRHRREYVDVCLRLVGGAISDTKVVLADNNNYHDWQNRMRFFADALESLRSASASANALIMTAELRLIAIAASEKTFQLAATPPPVADHVGPLLERFCQIKQRLAELK